jgi:hypothetical protein
VQAELRALREEIQSLRLTLVDNRKP